MDGRFRNVVISCRNYFVEMEKKASKSKINEGKLQKKSTSCFKTHLRFNQPTYIFLETHVFIK